MTPEDLRERTFEFAARTRRFCRPYLRDIETEDAARQLLRSSASVASNYRAACLARSHAEFTARLGIVLDEADESEYWAKYLRAGGLEGAELDAICLEATELTRIFRSSRRTSLANDQRDQPRRHRPDPTRRG